MELFVKNPIPVAAVLVTTANRDNVVELLSSGTTDWKELDTGFLVHSLEGVEPVAYDNDYYIIRGVDGECYPIKGEIFRKSYSPYRELPSRCLSGSIDLLPDKKLHFQVWKNTNSVNMWFVDISKGYEIQYAYVERHDISHAVNYILEAVEKFKDGFIECTYCGKWIRLEDAHHFSPAACSCGECLEKAKRDESEFLSMLD